jgi:hypothetical protein
MSDGNLVQSTPNILVTATTMAGVSLPGRVQNEAVALASRRAQAYLELPHTLSRCRTPQDILTAHVMFWQIAQRQYAQGLESVVGSIPMIAIASTVSELLAPTKLPPTQVAESVTARPRDYLVVSESDKSAKAVPERSSPLSSLPASERLRKTG